MFTTRNVNCLLKMNQSKPHLFLHFDVNKTILIDDPASKKTTHNLLNEIISDSTFGVVKDNVSKGFFTGFSDL